MPDLKMLRELELKIGELERIIEIKEKELRDRENKLTYLEKHIDMEHQKIHRLYGEKDELLQMAKKKRDRDTDAKLKILDGELNEHKMNIDMTPKAKNEYQNEKSILDAERSHLSLTIAKLEERRKDAR